MTANYSEDSIKTLDWKEHIRKRPGMYIGKLGDGSDPDDGIYVLLKEVMDNSIDEFMMGFGKIIEVDIKEENETWTTIKIENVIVKNNEVEIGFLADGRAGAYCLVYDVSVVKSK